MSWSIAVAQTSSRSSGSPGCRPAAASASHISSASRATCSEWVKSVSYWAARLRTDSRRTSLASPSGYRRSKKTPSRRPASVASKPGEPARLQHGVDDQRARQDQVAARGLDTRDVAALGRVQRAELLDQLPQRLTRDEVPLDAVGGHPGRELRRRRQVADGAADRDQAPVRTQPRRARQLGSDVLAQRPRLLLLARREALGHAHGAQRPRPRVRRQPVLHHA